MRAGNLGVPLTSEWLNGVLAPGSRVGIDPVSKILVLIPPCSVMIISISITSQREWWLSGIGKTS